MLLVMTGSKASLKEVCFTIVFKNQGVDSIDIRAANVENRDLWVDSLNEILEELNED